MVARKSVFDNTRRQRRHPHWIEVTGHACKDSRRTIELEGMVAAASALAELAAAVAWCSNWGQEQCGGGTELRLHFGCYSPEKTSGLSSMQNS